MILLPSLFEINVNFSLTWVIFWMLLGIVTFFSMRWLVYFSIKLLFEKKRCKSKIIIIGTQAVGQKLAKDIETSKTDTNLEVIAFFDSDKALQNQTLENIPVIHDILSLPNFVESQKINEIWITPGCMEASDLERVLSQLYDQLVTVRFVGNLFSFPLINPSATVQYGLPVITLTESPMISEFNRLLKYIEDKVIASLVLLLVSPLMLIIALRIKLTSPGPIFFCQERVSWNGQRFIMFKFRSMVMNAEQGVGPVWSDAKDKRATGFGAYLRNTSLDELPQFWNVLKGDMSIVGPRPERPYFIEKFKGEIPGYMQKHLVKAGITGWAQLNGWRGNTDLCRRIEHDIFYIENWSVWFDLKIIFMTVFKIFFNTASHTPGDNTNSTPIGSRHAKSICPLPSREDRGEK